MKKGKLLKTCSIILASFLIVSAVTTDVSCVAKAEEAQTDSRADFDLPVIEEFKCTPSSENLTSNDSLNIEIKAYDAISGIKDISVSVRLETEKNQYWSSFYTSLRNDEIAYDKEKNVYVANIPLKSAYAECTAIVDRLEITDNYGNKLICGTLENNKMEDVLVRKNPNNWPYEYKYTYSVKPDLADSGITISNLHPSENVEAQSDGSYKVTGDTVTFEYESSDATKMEDCLYLNYEVDNLLSRSVSAGKNSFSIKIKENGDSLKNNHEIKFSDFALRTSDGTYKKINVADGMKTAFALNYTREQQNHESEKVEASIEFFKDGQPLKNMDKVVKGDKISCKVTFDKEINLPTDFMPHLSLELKSGAQSVESKNGWIALKLDENNKKFASGEIDTTDLYPTDWMVGNIMDKQNYIFKLKNDPGFILTTKDGSTNIPEVNVHLTIPGMNIVSCKLPYGAGIEESVKSYIDQFEKSCEFKPSSWSVYSSSNGKYERISSLSEFKVSSRQSSYYVWPEFDSNVRYCREYAVDEYGRVYAKGYKYREFADGLSDEQIAEVLTKELKLSPNIADNFDKLEVNNDQNYSMYPNEVKLSVKYSSYDVTFEVMDPVVGDSVKEIKTFKREDVCSGIVSYLKNKRGIGEGFEYWCTGGKLKENNVSLDEYYNTLAEERVRNFKAGSCSITVYGKYAGKKTYRSHDPIAAKDICVLADESASKEDVIKLFKAKIGKIEIKGAKNPRIEFSLYGSPSNTNIINVGSELKADNSIIHFSIADKDSNIQWIEGADGDVITLPTSYGKYTNITWYLGKTEIKDNKFTIEPGKNYYVDGGVDSAASDEPVDKPSTEQPTDKPEDKPTEKPEDKPSTEKPSEPTVVLPEESKLESEPVISGAEGNNVTVENKLVIGTNNTVKDENGVTKLDKNTADAVANQITKTLLEAEKAKAEGKHVEKTVVKVELADATTVPKEILEAAKGSDVDVVLEMAGGYSWTINGNDIKASNLKEINLEVKQNVNVVPSGLIKELAGDKPTRQLSLTHNGDFGFKATLNFNMGSEYAGQYGNLYYYDSEGKLKFQNAGKIGEDGTCGVVFSHASDYVVVVGEDMTPSTAKAPVTGDNANLTLYFVLLFVGIVLFSSIAFVWFRKKSRA